MVTWQKVNFRLILFDVLTLDGNDYFATIMERNL